MIRYIAASLTLKAFSLNKTTEKVYRFLGNTFGSRKRKNTNLSSYIDRGDQLLHLQNMYRPLGHNEEVLEIGTGWMHWYGLYLRLHNYIKLTTYDVWDNRQWGALKACFTRLYLQTPAERVSNSTLEELIQCRGMHDLYNTMGMQHIIDPKGSMAYFRTEQFASTFSMDVLEHVQKDQVSDLLRELHRITKKGGVSIHQIGIDDHLSHYDKGVHEKNYIRYPEWAWKLFFQNKVQYINRIQHSEWRRRFRAAGFQVIHAETRERPIGKIKPRGVFAYCDQRDLQTVRLTVVLRKL